VPVAPYLQPVLLAGRSAAQVVVPGSSFSASIAASSSLST
jgi:hypothetical protein